MAKRKINFGLIGCGLMGREFASAAARWSHLDSGPSTLNFEPQIVAVCSRTQASMAWFRRNIPTVRLATTDYRDLLADPEIDAIYCAVPHNLHEQIYVETIRRDKHLLGEKPFGIDLAANEAIQDAIDAHPQVLVRCASEFPFFPGAYRIGTWVREGRVGTLIEIEAGFWHSSDLNPNKPINWKRRIETNGAYGCMGDLGLHVVHMPFRFGWRPKNVRALLSKIVDQRPDGQGGMAPCETWDNAVLACEVDASTHVEAATYVEAGAHSVPMLLSTKRIAPGHGNSWFIKVIGTRLSASFSTQHPKQLAYLPYAPGDEQAWRVLDLPHASAYPTITGSIFEFGFSDAILQMWAAFCDELVNGKAMLQPFHCATPEETHLSHLLFTAALESQRTGQTVSLSQD